METFWVNEQGLRPSERVVDPLVGASVHSVKYYTKTFHIPKGVATAAELEETLGESHPLSALDSGASEDTQLDCAV